MPKVNDILNQDSIKTDYVRVLAVIFVYKTFTSHRPEILFMSSVRKEAASQIQKLIFFFPLWVFTYYHITLSSLLLYCSAQSQQFISCGLECYISKWHVN